MIPEPGMTCGVAKACDSPRRVLPMPADGKAKFLEWF